MRQKLEKRYLFDSVIEDLESRKMVFFGGPRQVGKTTLSYNFLSDGMRLKEGHPGYLNWDNLRNRTQLLKGELPANQPLIVLDEIHKFARWRNLVKGFYDKNRSTIQFIVTGSARLDCYRKGGDSLVGRYHYYRLHPFSLSEFNSDPTPDDLKILMRFGGFPEPLLRQSEVFHRRWQRERLERVVHEDLRDLEKIREISLIDLLLDALPERVGAPLSVKSLRELLQVSHESVERWIQILERLYVCYRIAPYGSPRIRAVKKEQKLYFWDWSAVQEPGPRFENFVASQLLKFCHFQEDTQGYRMELRYLRDTDKREVDFVVLQDRKPVFAVECKTGEKAVSPAAHYFRERTPIPRFYQVHLGEKDYGNEEGGVRVLPFVKFCKELGLP